MFASIIIGSLYAGPLGGMVVLIALNSLSHEWIHVLAARILHVEVKKVSVGFKTMYTDLLGHNDDVARVYLCGAIWDYIFLFGVGSFALCSKNLLLNFIGIAFFLIWLIITSQNPQSDYNNFRVYRQEAKENL